MDKDFSRQFTKCPVCTLRTELACILALLGNELTDLRLIGSGEDRFFEQLGKEMKERGLAREEWEMRLDVKQGAVVDPARQANIPIGSEVPGYGYMTDVCMDCGCVYAIDLTRTDVKKSIAPTPPPQPNRAERRRDNRGGLPPSLN